MSVAVALAPLIAYSDHEREKWRQWIAADPARMRIPFQTGGRFADVAALLDHVFLVERRHLARLEGATPPPATGVPSGDWGAMFEYGDLVRADFRAYLDALDEATASQTMVITGLQSSADVVMTRRRLVTQHGSPAPSRTSASSISGSILRSMSKVRWPRSRAKGSSNQRAACIARIT